MNPLAPPLHDYLSAKLSADPDLGLRILTKIMAAGGKTKEAETTPTLHLAVEEAAT